MSAAQAHTLAMERRPAPSGYDGQPYATGKSRREPLVQGIDVPALGLAASLDDLVRRHREPGSGAASGT
jgi:hypothetical protein